MALTLRSVAGLTVPEIARAFLSTEQRDGAPADAGAQQGHRRADPVPGAAATTCSVERLAGVLRVVYLVFNEGHAATRGDLRAEAIRLARLLVRLMPDEAEVHGLLALLLLTDARSAARMSDGELVSLADQDRSLWDAARSRRAWPCSSARCGSRGPARTRSRPRSPRVHARRRRSPTPTGRRSPASTRELAAPRPVAGGRPQPRGRGRLRRGPRGRARAAARRSAPGPLRRRCTPRAPTCCAARATHAAAARRRRDRLHASEAERTRSEPKGTVPYGLGERWDPALLTRGVGSAEPDSAPARDSAAATTIARPKPSANDA